MLSKLHKTNSMPGIVTMPTRLLQHTVKRAPSATRAWTTILAGKPSATLLIGLDGLS